MHIYHIYIYIYIHAYIYEYIYIHTHSFIDTYMHAYHTYNMHNGTLINYCIRIHMHTFINTSMHTNVYVCHIRLHTCACILQGI